MEIGSTTLTKWDGPIGIKPRDIPFNSTPNYQNADRVSISNEAREAQENDQEYLQYVGVPPKPFGELYLQLFKVMFEEEKEIAQAKLPPGETLSEEQIVAIADKTKQKIFEKLGLPTKPTDALTNSENDEKQNSQKIGAYHSVQTGISNFL
ncbi:MAG: hypothetical protein OEM38_11425 [Gammaproteobacteria bacterium]|nr:hypothetical protein [Gammaproteobacteria bacterium]